MHSRSWLCFFSFLFCGSGGDPGRPRKGETIVPRKEGWTTMLRSGLDCQDPPPPPTPRLEIAVLIVYGVQYAVHIDEK